jgi:hypothetical protein
MPFKYLRPEDIAEMSIRQLERHKDAAFDHWRSKGFPYPDLSRRQLEQQYSQFAMSCRSVFLLKTPNACDTQALS